MSLDETILKAQQMANMLHSDIRDAWRTVANVRRPEGPTIGDKATEVYLLDVLELVNKVRWKLAAL